MAKTQNTNHAHIIRGAPELVIRGALELHDMSPLRPRQRVHASTRIRIAGPVSSTGHPRLPGFPASCTTTSGLSVVRIAEHNAAGRRAARGRTCRSKTCNTCFQRRSGARICKTKQNKRCKTKQNTPSCKTKATKTIGEEVPEPFELDGCVPRCDPRGEPSPSTPSTLRCASSMMTRMRRGSSPAGTGTRGLVDCDDRQWPSATIGNGHRQRSAAAIGNTSRS